MRNKKDRLVDAYYRYSKDIGENIGRFDIIDRVDRLDEEMVEKEVDNMKRKGYWK